MIQINVKADFKGAIKELERKRKSVPQVIRRALINTALAVRDAEQEEMRRVFDRPTRWTIGAIRVKAMDNLTVAVGVVDPDGFYRRANYYLGTQIAGGGRKQKAFESALSARGILPKGWFAVPGAGAKLDQFGNMGQGQIRQILSYFQAAERWAGSTQNMSAAKISKLRQGTKKAYGFEYFVIQPGEKGGKLIPGIYSRTFTGFGSAVKPVLVFVSGVSYRKRLDIETVARRVIEREWPRKFESAAAKALA